MSQRAIPISDQAARSNPPDFYVFGEGLLSVQSDDDGLRDRFRQLYPEGGPIPPAAWSGPVVRCRVTYAGNSSLAIVAFDDPEPLDAFQFCRSLFADRGYVEGPAGPDGWRTFALATRPQHPFVSLRQDMAIADRSQAWQPFIANYAVNRLLRRQRNLVFFHAATVAIGTAGVLITGPKNAGKTTTSLALTARGHAFLGDELAAIRTGDAMLLPVRRAASLRAGIRAGRVESALAAGDYVTEIFPDGQERMRVSVARMFPSVAASPVPLFLALFLRSKGGTPAAEFFNFTARDFKLLPPLASSVWEVSPGRRTLEIARLMGKVRCYFLDLGQPEETAQMIERLVGGT